MFLKLSPCYVFRMVFCLYINFFLGRLHHGDVIKVKHNINILKGICPKVELDFSYELSSSLLEVQRHRLGRAPNIQQKTANSLRKKSKVTTKQIKNLKQTLKSPYDARVWKPYYFSSIFFIFLLRFILFWLLLLYSVLR